MAEYAIQVLPRCCCRCLRYDISVRICFALITKDATQNANTTPVCILTDVISGANDETKESQDVLDVIRNDVMSTIYAGE